MQAGTVQVFFRRRCRTSDVLVRWTAILALAAGFESTAPDAAAAYSAALLAKATAVLSFGCSFCSKNCIEC